MRFCANPKHTVAASVGGFDGFFEILHGRHHAIVYLHDDNALGDAGILEFSGFDAADQKTIAETQFALFVVGEYAQGGSHRFGVDCFEITGGTLLVAQREGCGVFLFLAEIGHFHLVAGTMYGNDLLQLAELVDFLAVNGRHDVAFLQTGSIGCTVCGDFCDIETGECAEVGLFALVFLFVDVVRHRSSADAQQRALHYAKFAEVFHHLVHNGGRDSKAVSAVRTCFGVDHRVDTDQFARSIDECTAGVTGIDGGIGLNEAFYRIGRLHGTGFRADDAGSDGGGEAIRIADGEHPFSDFQFLTATYGDGLQVFGFDLDQSEIRIFVLSDDTAFELAIVIEFHQNLVSIFHNVVVGDDISVGCEDNS